MEVEIRQLPAKRLVGFRHVGPYREIGKAFERLEAWMKESGFRGGAMVAIYHDNPNQVPPGQLRSDACIEIPGDAVIPAGEAQIHEIPAGEYAWGRHLGPYSGLPQAWGTFLTAIPDTGRQVVDGPSFEIYVNDCCSVPPEEVITDLYQPVSRS